MYMRLVDIQSNLFNKDTEGAVKIVPINARARCPYKTG